MSTYVATKFAVPFFASSNSMQPTISKGAHGFIKGNVDIVERLDIVMYTTTKDAPHAALGRVLGLPGETISIRNGLLHINNNPRPIEEPYVTEINKNLNFEQETLDADEYFIITDNRGDEVPVISITSKKNIIGKVWFLL